MGRLRRPGKLRPLRRDRASSDTPGLAASTRDLDLLKVDVDTIAIVIRSRGASASTGVQGEDASEADHSEREGPSGSSD